MRESLVMTTLAQLPSKKSREGIWISYSLVIHGYRKEETPTRTTEIW